MSQRRAWSRLSAFAALALAASACQRFSPEVDAGPAPVASKELNAAKAPPKPRAAPAIPPLPDLPILEKQEPRAALPFGIKLPTTRGPAAAAPARGGLTWNGNELVALPRATNGLLFDRDGAGARALVSSRLLAHNDAVLPRIVDHRFVGVEGPVRNQKQAPSCTAFALATAIDHAVSRWTGQPVNVSVMQIWSRYRSPYATRAIGSNLGQPIALDASWAFDDRTATGWVACELGAPPPKEGCGLTPSPALASKAANEGAVTLTEVSYLDEPSLDDLREHLAAGQDVIVGLDLPASFAPTGKAGSRYVPHWTKEQPEGGHALVVAGYVTLAHATYFLLHNSWGTGWGDGGYAWIHATTLLDHLREALVVDAEPILRDAARQKRVRGALTCAAGLIPDSLRGTCTPPCPDGSPRSDGVCPVAGQCPAGFVNLTGTCVLAAPTVRGNDPKTGIAWACGPGGCTYDLPRRSDPDCKGNTCKASCPAPIFRIATVADDLTCIE